MNKSIALIGGGGFIGTNLANFFITKDYNVLIICRNIIDNRKLISGKIKIELLDVNNVHRLVKALAEYENVVWLVNDIVPSASMDSLVDDFTFNVNPLIRFLESSNKLYKLKRFVFISSGGTIYGDSPNKIDLKENYPKKPISAYGLSKIISENYIEFITQRSTFESIILRPSNVYGNFQNLKKPQGIVGYALNALVHKKNLDLYNDGKVIRDFIHVLDLAEAVKCCLESRYEESKVEVYNVGSQIGYSIREIINLINTISNDNIKTISRPPRPIDCNYNVLDISKFKNKFGWEPKIEIENGLYQVWKWILSENEKAKLN
jgi:Nucleoside-diphosphate-sugar epimerases